MRRRTKKALFGVARCRPMCMYTHTNTTLLHALDATSDRIARYVDGHFLFVFWAMDRWTTFSIRFGRPDKVTGR